MRIRVARRMYGQKVAEMKNCPMDEVNKKLKEFRELGMLGYHDQGNWRKWGI